MGSARAACTSADRPGPAPIAFGHAHDTRRTHPDVAASRGFAGSAKGAGGLDGIRAGGVDDQRVDGDAFAGARAADDASGSLVAEDQRRRPARIVAMIGMHVGAAYADRLDLTTTSSARPQAGFLAQFQGIRAGINQSAHVASLLFISYFAVKPPSTAKVCPVI